MQIIPRSRQRWLHLLAGIALLAAAGCSTTSVTLPAEPPLWDVKPAGCVKAAPPEIILGPGRLLAKDFAWANSEIEFKLFDPADAAFGIVFYDRNFATEREQNSRNWFTMVNGKTILVSKTIDTWPALRVHAMMVEGDQKLAEKGFRAFGGDFTLAMRPAGDPGQPATMTLADNFKINQWNQIRLVIQEGVITAYVNGQLGQSITTDRHLNGPFGFQVDRGQLRISNIRLKKL